MHTQPIQVSVYTIAGSWTQDSTSNNATLHIHFHDLFPTVATKI